MTAARGKNNGIDNKRKILKSARKIFQKKGGQQTSLADIAKAAGISKGTLYYYYSTKAELIYDITHEHMNSMTESLLKVVENKADSMDAAKIIHLVYDTIIKAESRAKLHLYLVQEAIIGNDELQKRFQHAYTEWRQMIYTGLQSILKRRKDIDILSHVLLTSITGGMIQQLLGIEDLPLEEMSNWLINKR
ncbi:TetR/AcrR family transcriptional regulator [Marispirochaeta sp.]|jgi:AcrR family transcriptional regulator|uniref:TetR/AcrR family transcriptional regulator n=1 Tax=Marispirochaeta sp. TaxID=2038653 RepID=UPI0029C77199|nr:TetR/AcrR family transcriptional regulator [Marispirochaeta sp.]